MNIINFEEMKKARDLSDEREVLCKESKINSMEKLAQEYRKGNATLDETIMKMRMVLGPMNRR